jgi:hypothetical protein
VRVRGVFCGGNRVSDGCHVLDTAPSTRSIGIQVEMDEDMTTRVLDLSVQVC